MEIILAIVIGAAFGAVLDRIGATNPNLIGKMLNLTNLHLMKTILLAIGVASVLTFAGQMAGLVDVGNMSVKTAYAGVFIGGLMLGFGWALSGFCPGTGVCAAAAGRRDAWAFVAGGLLGAARPSLPWPGPGCSRPGPGPMRKDRVATLHVRTQLFGTPDKEWFRCIWFS